MLLIGKETREFKLKLNSNGFETNNNFTKFLVTPLRDTSISAAQRAKSATSRSTVITRKLIKLNSLKQQLNKEKELFSYFTKTTEFFEKIEKIVENRFKAEENSVIVIQSHFRGYLTRKLYIQKRIQIDREVTNKLVQDLQLFVANCHNTYLGHKAAVVIQKHWKRVVAQRVLKNSLTEIREKLRKDEENVLIIQKKFRQFLSGFKYRAVKHEYYKENKLLFIRIKIAGRVITRFMRKTIERLALQREEQRKLLTTASRRKGIRNVRCSKQYTQKSDFFTRFSQVISSGSEDKEMIPNVFSIFRVGRQRNRPLTPSEHTQLQTEASSIRRRSVSVKRSLPKIEKFSLVKEVKEEEKKVKDKEKNVRKSELYLQNTESSYNRMIFKDQPPTPEFLKVEKKSRKINWTFLKPTITSEIYKASRYSGKSAALSTHFTRSPSPSTSSRPRVQQSGHYPNITNPSLYYKSDCYSILS